MLIPMYFWGESLKNAFFVTYAWRLVNTLHGTWFVNSAGHMFGDNFEARPYDKRIKPVENWFVSFGSAGEGYHNFHHSYVDYQFIFILQFWPSQFFHRFPWDYATSEGSYTHNVTKRLIEFFAFLGLAKNLRKAKQDMVEARKAKVASAAALKDSINYEFC